MCKRQFACPLLCAHLWIRKLKGTVSEISSEPLCNAIFASKPLKTQSSYELDNTFYNF